MSHDAERKRVKLADIVFDAGTQVRESINEAKVREYADLMNDGESFPPIRLVFDSTRYYLVDGFHRVLAAQRNGYVAMDADVKFGSLDEAIWEALGANRVHGLQMTDGDKRKAITIALDRWYFNRGMAEKNASDIARQVGCVESYVRKIRDEIELRTSAKLPDRVPGADNKARPATRPRPQTMPEPEPAPAPITSPSGRPLYGKERASAERFEARKAAAVEGASEALLRKLPRKKDGEMFVNVVQTLQGIVSAMDAIDAAAVLADENAAAWMEPFAEAIAALRKFNRQLSEAA